MMELAGKLNCDPAKSICVFWQGPNVLAPPDRGAGTAFRISGTEQFAQIKTTGFSSNTTISIIQNDSLATTIIGNGYPGGNIVNIIQNTGVVPKP